MSERGRWRWDEEKGELVPMEAPRLIEEKVDRPRPIVVVSEIVERGGPK